MKYRYFNNKDAATKFWHEIKAAGYLANRLELNASLYEVRYWNM